MNVIFKGAARGGGMLLAILLFTSVIPAQAEPISFAECRTLLEERSFSSGEELLQLFSILYRSDPDGAYTFDRPVLDSLSRELRTYFPLNHLDSVVYAERRLVLHFDRPRSVAIPGLMRQAFMHFSDKLVLAVHDDYVDDKMIVFDVRGGRVAVTTTWLLKVFTPFALDARGTSLFYRSDDSLRMSVLGMRQDVAAPAESLDIRVKPGREVQVNAHHPDMRRRVDLRFRPGYLEYFGFKVELPKFNYIKCSGYEREFKPDAYSYFTDVISRVLAAPQKMFDHGVTRHLLLEYHLEEQRGVFWQEFEFGMND